MQGYSHLVLLSWPVYGRLTACKYSPLGFHRKERRRSADLIIPKNPASLSVPEQYGLLINFRTMPPTPKDILQE